MKVIVYISIFSFLLFSCNKDRTLHIKALNPVTNQPYAGLQYYVVQEKTGMNSEEFTTVASGTLNSNGEAYPLVKIRKNRSYAIRVEEPPNTCYNKIITHYYAIQDDKNPTFMFEFAKCAYINVKVNNANCQGESDIFNYRERYSYTDWSGWSYDITGCFSNMTEDYYKSAEGWRIFNWKVNRSGTVTEYIDSIYLVENEYVSFIMEY